MLLPFAFALLGVASAAAPKEVCYRSLGCFSTEAPWYTFLRPLPSPSAPESIQTSFELYTRNRQAVYMLRTVPETSVNGSDFDPQRPSVFIVHGFLERGNIDWMVQMKDVLLDRADVNVFLVDWRKGSFELFNYLQASANTRVVGAQIARLINQLIADYEVKAQDFHIIGFSLGGQVAGYAGKIVRGLGKITALDPAQPAFEGFVRDVHLVPEDAEFVEVIHTSARVFFPLFGFGMRSAVGHVDYYINDGAYQPGCILPLGTLKPLETMEALTNFPFDLAEKLVACDHGRAHRLYTEVLRERDCVFWGHPVNAPADSLSQECSINTCLPLHYESNSTYKSPGWRGSYIVPTLNKEPFCIADGKQEVTLFMVAQKALLKINQFVGGPLEKAVGGAVRGVVTGAVNGAGTVFNGARDGADKLINRVFHGRRSTESA